MAQHAPNHHQRQSNQAKPETIPAFKPVALPALAAAMRSAKQQPSKTKKPTPPAILRKEADFDR